MVVVSSVMREAPENIFAKRLASNEKKIRDKAVKKLKQWIGSRSKTETFSSLQLLKIWKGLFYCMYMSDKPLVQEELSESIGGLIHAFPNYEVGLEFYRSGLQVIASEWNGLDKWRMDKFMMFLRRLLRHALSYVANMKWSDPAVKMLASVLSEEVVNANKSVTSVKSPLTIQIQFTDILFEEIAKVGGDNLKSETLMPFINIFIEYLAFGSDPRMRDAVKKSVFYHLINQSDIAIAHQSGLTVEELKEALEDAEPTNLEDQPKDPRAGKVDIELPQLKPDYSKIASELMEKAGLPNVKSLSRKFMYTLVGNFKDMSAGVYPLDPILPEVPEGITYEEIDKATERFLEEEDELKSLDVEEKKKIRKAKLQAKKEKAKLGTPVVEEEVVPMSNNQLRIVRRKAALEEKLAKKPKLTESAFVVEDQSDNEHEDEHDGPVIPKNVPLSAPLAAVPSAPSVTQVVTKKDKKVRVPKQKQPIVHQLVSNGEVTPKPVHRTPSKTVQPAVDPAFAGPAIRVDLSPQFNKTQKRKIEFAFDDDFPIDCEDIVLKAIKKTKTEEQGPWVPGVKTMQHLRIQAGLAAARAGRIPKKEEKQEELLDKTPYALLKTKKKSQPKVKKVKSEKPKASAEVITPVENIIIQEPIVVEAPVVVAPQAEERIEQITPPTPEAPVAKETKDEWNTSLKEGELEIVIPNKKYTGKRKLKPETKSKEPVVALTSAKSNKVKFVLQKNKAQDPLEYMHAVKTSPGIPHDPNKKPRISALKLTDSPIPTRPSFGKKPKKSSK